MIRFLIFILLASLIFGLIGFLVIPFIKKLVLSEKTWFDKIDSKINKDENNDKKYY